MSEQDAQAFLDRVTSEEDFARELEAVKDDPSSVVSRVRAAGFDVTPDEVRQAFLDRYGAELTEDQLESISAGNDLELGFGIAGGLAIAIGASAALAAAY